MKPIEVKQAFIQLRAEGKSFNVIASELHISKSTCTQWERDFSSEIDTLKKAELEELYESYGMTKEARIKRLGSTLEKIDDALDKVDLSEVDPAKLLDYKLKYTDALKGEYMGQAVELEDLTAKGILTAIIDLLNRVRAGEVTTAQAQRESLVLSNLLRAYDTTEIKAQMDKLEAIVGGQI